MSVTCHPALTHTEVQLGKTCFCDSSQQQAVIHKAMTCSLSVQCKEMSRDQSNSILYVKACFVYKQPTYSCQGCLKLDVKVGRLGQTVMAARPCSKS